MILVTGFDVVTEKLGPLVVSALHDIGAHAISKRSALISDVERCRTLVLIPASFNRDYDAHLLQVAYESGKRVVILADTWQGKRRVPVAHIANVHLLFYPFRQEEAEVESLGYKCLSFCVVPPHWSPMYREMSAAKHDPAPFVYVNGVKDGYLTNRVLNLTMRVAVQRGLAVGFRAHPAEAGDMWRERMNVLYRGNWFDCSKVSASVAAARARASVFIGGSTDSIIACFARLPGVYYTDSESIERNKKSGFPDGKWIAEYGGLPSVGEHNLAVTLDHVLSEGGRAGLFAEQVANFTLPKTWDTAPEIAKLISQ